MKSTLGYLSIFTNTAIAVTTIIQGPQTNLGNINVTGNEEVRLKRIMIGNSVWTDSTGAVFKGRLDAILIELIGALPSANTSYAPTAGQVQRNYNTTGMKVMVVPDQDVHLDVLMTQSLQVNAYARSNNAGFTIGDLVTYELIFEFETLTP